MLTTDECEKIIENCYAFDLLPVKRTTQAQRDKVSKFKKTIKDGKNDTIRILTSVALKMITGQRAQSDNLDIKNAEQYREIINDINYCDMATEDICVSFYNQSCHFREQRKKAQEDLYNQREELNEIIENQKYKIKESIINNTVNLNTIETLEKTNETLRDKLLQYDSDNEEEQEELNYDNMDQNDNLHQIINSLKEELDEAKYQNSMLKGQLETNEIVDYQSEEEDTANEEAQAIFDNAAKRNEEKRLANRKKHGLV